MPQLYTDTAEGAELGMILDRAAHKLKPGEVSYLQDCLVNQPGLVNRRGAIQGATALGNNLAGFRPIGVAGCYDPQGVFRIMVMHASNVRSASSWELWGAIYDTNMTFISRQPLGVCLISSSMPGLYCNVQQAVDGSVLIGYGYGPDQTFGSAILARWYGCAPTVLYDFLAGSPTTVTVGVTTDSTVITGTTTEIAKIKPGAVLNGLGVVTKIVTTTSATLKEANAFTGTFSFSPGISVVQAIEPIRTRGAISAALAGTTVTGYGTRFKESYGGATSFMPAFVIRDPADTTTITTYGGGGLIDSDTNLITGGLGPNAKNVSLGPYWFSAQNDTYRFPTALEQWQNVGKFACSYKGHMFYFNTAKTGLTSRVYIGGPTRIDEMDHTQEDGAWFDVPSTGQGDLHGIGCMGGRNAAVFCKARETFGLFGDDIDSFVLNKIADDGCLTSNSLTKWGGDVIWIGRTGIWKFDGVNPPENIIAGTIGSARWQQLTAAFQNDINGGVDATNNPLNQCHTFVHRDHLFVNITNTNSQHVIYTDGVARTSNPMQLAIYLPTGAVTYLSNFNFVGFLPGWPPSNQGKGYVLLAQNASTSHFLFPVDNLFTQGVATTDAIVTSNCALSGAPGSLGPWFHMESAKYDEGDGLLRKAWKRILTQSLLTNTKRMFLETVIGLNTTGVRQTTPYTGTGLWQAAMVKFNARNQYLSFRLYEDTANRPATLTIGPWQMVWKPGRRGAV